MAGSQLASAARVSWAKDMVFVASVATRSDRRMASSSAGTPISMARACSTALSASSLSSSMSAANSGASKDAYSLVRSQVISFPPVFSYSSSSTNSMMTGLWSEHLKPVSITRHDSTVTFPDTMKPSSVLTKVSPFT